MCAVVRASFSKRKRGGRRCACQPGRTRHAPPSTQVPPCSYKDVGLTANATSCVGTGVAFKYGLFDGERNDLDSLRNESVGVWVQEGNYALIGEAGLCAFCLRHTHTWVKELELELLIRADDVDAARRKRNPGRVLVSIIGHAQAHTAISLLSSPMIGKSTLHPFVACSISLIHSSSFATLW